MAVMPMLTFLALFLYAHGQEINPCPFNTEDCLCKDDPDKPGDPLLFQIVECKPKSGLLPKFESSPMGRYNVSGSFSIKKANVLEIPANHFAAFQSIGQLVLQQLKQSPSDPAPVKWHDDAFAGLEIDDLFTKFLDGIVPPPASITNIKNLGVLDVVAAVEPISLTEGCFKGLPRLFDLLIDSTPIKEISPKAFAGLEDRLKYLNFFNVISDLEPFTNALAGMRNLRMINWDDNSIKEIKRGVFPEVSLKTLWMTYNPIEKIETGAFSSLQGLSDLWLDLSNLTSVDLAIVADIKSSSLRVKFDESDLLKTLTTTETEKFTPNSTISFFNTALENIDSKISDLLANVPSLRIKLTRNVHLKCEGLAWMSKVTCPERIVIDGSQCADKNQQPLDEYLKSIDPSSKCLKSKEMDDAPMEKKRHNRLRSF